MVPALTNAQLAAYLERVGLRGAPGRDLSGLRDLHHAQLFNIPFENLDIRLGGRIDLSPDALLDKLVRRRRGGYCFELNGLLLLALRALGFDARPLLARVHLEEPPSGRTHQVNLVRLDGESWAVDVGFGAGSPRVPLPLREGVTETGVAAYELRREEPWGWLLRTREADQWRPSYSFDLGWMTAADIEVANHYTSTSPRTFFTQISVVGLPTPHGRISLRDRVLTEVDYGESRQREVAAGTYLGLLRDRFGIHLDSIPPMD